MPQVLITGANRGIGLEFARQYAADGWQVTATAREPERADELNKLEGVRVEQLDMRDLESVTAFGGRIGDAPLDLLIANAGTWIPETADSAEEGRAWADMLIVNSIAPYLLARSVLRQIAAARGKLIAISSKMGSIADNSSGGYVPYRTSKAALNMAWHSLALETKPLGIFAAVLNPGWVRTRMGGPTAPTPPEHSVADMRRIIDQLGPEQSGGFIDRDGSSIPW
jgi:NAD(P)-dependent dehydrogenase (short-subunit alcohol dehydrogenase family)